MTLYRSRRMFVQRYHAPNKTLLVIGILAALAACAPRTEDWSVAESPKVLRIDRAEFHHVIHFRHGSTTVSEAEQATLERFLRRHGIDQGVRIRIVGRSTALDIRREAALLAFVRNHGLNGPVDPAGSEAAPEDGGIRLTLVRHVVTPPACRDWSKNPVADHANEPSSNFGCATTANLGLMVADPRVLLDADETGPADGATLARGVKEYREGTAKKGGPGGSPVSISTTSGQGG